MIIMPMETLREKKSWLMASSRICRKRCTVNPLKLGGQVVSEALQAGTHSAGIIGALQRKGINGNTISTSRTGIINRETRSTPPSAPL